MSVRDLMLNDSDGKTLTQDHFSSVLELCGYTENLTLISACANGVDTRGTNTVDTRGTNTVDAYSSGMLVVLVFYTLPVVIVLGIFGNALTLYVIRNTPLQKYSVCLYMCANCIANILSLSFKSGVHWFLLIVQEQHFQDYSDPVCRLWQFFIRLVEYSGAWFVVAMTIDRYITVWHQHKQKEMCTKFVAKLVVCVIMVGLVCISVHALWSVSVEEGRCAPNVNSMDLHSVIWSWTSFVCYSLLPVFLIFIFGNLICVRMCWKNTNREHTEITHATVIICCFYFFLRSPVVVIDIIMNTLPDEWGKDEQFVLRIQNFRQVALVMMYVAYTTIFPVMCVCCSQFRIFLVRKCSCGGKRNIRLECTAV